MTDRWISVRLEGPPIEDMFVYRTTIHAWSYDSRLYLFPVSGIESLIRTELSDDPQAAAGACFQLFHSNRLGAAAGQYRSATRLSERDSDLDLVIDLDNTPYWVFETRLEANSLLDILIYADRIYCGTDEGLFELTEPQTIRSHTPHIPTWHTRKDTVTFESRIRHSCYSAAASLGSIAASCGDAGLRMLFDDFGYRSGQRAKERQVAVASERATFGSGGLFNFPSRNEFSYLEGQREDTNSSARSVPDKVLVGVEPASVSTSSDGSGSPFLNETLDYILFSRQRLIALLEGRVFAARLYRSIGGRRIAKRVHRIGRYKGKPLTACETTSSLIIETSDGLVAISHKDNTSTFRPCGPTVSIRSFPNSKRYLELATRTSEDGAYLHAAIPRPS